MAIWLPQLCRGPRYDTLSNNSGEASFMSSPGYPHPPQQLGRSWNNVLPTWRKPSQPAIPSLRLPPMNCATR